MRPDLRRRNPSLPGLSDGETRGLPSRAGRAPGFARARPGQPDDGEIIEIDGNKIHYDGAKDEEAVIQVWGMGPATSTPAERK